jgi:hypothetical protein
MSGIANTKPTTGSTARPTTNKGMETKLNKSRLFGLKIVLVCIHPKEKCRQQTEKNDASDDQSSHDDAQLF